MSIRLFFIYFILSTFGTIHVLSNSSLRNEHGFLTLPRRLDNTMENNIIPRYIILGVEKCGTTSFYNLISQHKHHISTHKKEFHYLTFGWYHKTNLGMNVSMAVEENGYNVKRWDKLYGAEKIYYDWHYRTYEDMFKAKGLVNQTYFTGEGSPTYFLYGHIVVPRIVAMMPRAKLLIIVRDPVDRAFSQYHMCNPRPNSFGYDHYFGLSFDDIIIQELRMLAAYGFKKDSEASYHDFMSYLKLACHESISDHGCQCIIARGMYDYQLEPYIQYFPINSSLKVIATDDIAVDTNRTRDALNDVYSFLGAEADDIHDTSRQNVHDYHDVEMNIQTRKLLSNFYWPYNERFYRMVGRDFGWNHHI